jgi:hypothetical protein
MQPSCLARMRAASRLLTIGLPATSGREFQELRPLELNAREARGDEEMGRLRHQALDADGIQA